VRNETPFFLDLRDRIRALGGIFNAHLHLDRSGTYHETNEMLSAGTSGAETSSLSLSAKHSLIPAIHASHFYDDEALAKRVNDFLDLMANAGTTRADTLVDVTSDRVKLSALKQFLALKRERHGTLDLQVGAYSPLGYKDSEPERWEILTEGAAIADFIGALPERDDQADYPDHIGFDEHCRRMLLLSQQLGKPLHIHVDQKNFPLEDGTERVIRLIRELGIPNPAGSSEPMVWLIHVISPSTYDEERFSKLLDSMVEHRIGVICCPSAAISMRQYRPILTPTFNSIARILDFLAAGVPVRVGSDNICDITSPAGTADMLDELFVLCNAIRFYDVDILAKLGAGRELVPAEMARVREHLKRDEAEVQRVVEAYRKAKSG
jgi:cytosine/adenosine deaminase-related metal-dependent hydrolase